MDSDKVTDHSEQEEAPKTPPQSGDNVAASNNPPRSPRDAATSSKRPCPEGAQNTESQNPFSGFMVPPSPPKYVSIEEIMKAAQGVSNMVLAHEIAVDNEFSLKKMEAPEDSLEKRVRDVMHKAFWDVLEEKLNEDPPDYNHALILLQEVKETLLELLLPYHGKLQNHINEVLDMDLIKQKAENGALDVIYYGEFVIGLMAKLCAPARDETVAKIKESQGVVPLFREIMRVLELMKMDMANFTIQQIRPFMQQQSVEYEKKKFAEFLKTQEENNVDGLQFTRDWLVRSVDKLQFPDSPREGATSASQPTPAAIINSAYMELLDWDERKTTPETLVMDAGRLADCKDQITRLTVISSVLLVTYNTVGAPIAGVQDLKQKLKDHISIIITDTPVSDLSSVMDNVADQVIKEVGTSLQTHGFPALDEAKHTLLRSQIKAITEENNPVYNIIKKRIHALVYQLISTARPERVQLPPGVSAVSEELSRVCGQFVRLISHNRAVFGTHYGTIIEALLRPSDPVDATST